MTSFLRSRREKAVAVVIMTTIALLSVAFVYTGIYEPQVKRATAIPAITKLVGTDLFEIVGEHADRRSFSGVYNYVHYTLIVNQQQVIYAFCKGADWNGNVLCWEERP